jgi:copper homeostasis protein
MTKRALLEMSVETLDAAIAAARGGADRIELCEDLSIGGVTPRAGLMQEARAKIAIPIFAMIRPRGGDFHYSAAEFAEMKAHIEFAKSTRMDGVVFGILTADGRVDIQRNAELVDLAGSLPATFHRAFDELTDLPTGLEEVISTGVKRLLTSGGAITAEQGAETLSGLLGQAGSRITILPGGGIRPGNLSKIARVTRAGEFHSGLSNLLPGPRETHAAFEEGVRALVRLLEEESRVLESAAKTI